MAVAYDNTTTAVTAAASSVSFSHTDGSNDNRLLLVAVALDDPTTTVTGITYNSVAMTLVVAKNSSADVRIELWQLVAPATGANTVAVSLSQNDDSVCAAISFDGVDQTFPLGATGTAAGTASPVSSSTTDTSTTDLVFDCGVIGENTFISNPTAGAGQTSRWNVGQGTFGAGHRAVGSTQAGVVGSVSASWTFGLDVEWAHIIVPVLEVAGPRLLSLLGVGV